MLGKSGGYSLTGGAAPLCGARRSAGGLKNIRVVMAGQSDLVAVLGHLDPKLVKMAPSGERPED